MVKIVSKYKTLGIKPIKGIYKGVDNMYHSFRELLSIDFIPITHKPIEIQETMKLPIEAQKIDDYRDSDFEITTKVGYLAVIAYGKDTSGDYLYEGYLIPIITMHVKEQQNDKNGYITHKTISDIVIFPDETVLPELISRTYDRPKIIYDATYDTNRILLDEMVMKAKSLLNNAIDDGFHGYISETIKDRIVKYLYRNNFLTDGKLLVDDNVYVYLLSRSEHSYKNGKWYEQQTVFQNIIDIISDYEYGSRKLSLNKSNYDKGQVKINKQVQNNTKALEQKQHGRKR